MGECGRAWMEKKRYSPVSALNNKVNGSPSLAVLVVPTQRCPRHVPYWWLRATVSVTNDRDDRGPDGATLVSKGLHVNFRN